MRSFLKIFFLTLILPSSAAAEMSDHPSINDFMAGLDRAAVSLEGYIRYSDDSSNLFNFVFITKDRVSFGVSVDAGREVRDEIEVKCEMNSIFYDLPQLCTIRAVASVEVDGSRIDLSIHEVLSLIEPVD